MYRRKRSRREQRKNKAKTAEIPASGTGHMVQRPYALSLCEEARSSLSLGK